MPPISHRDLPEQSIASSDVVQCLGHLPRPTAKQGPLPLSESNLNQPLAARLSGPTYPLAFMPTGVSVLQPVPRLPPFHRLRSPIMIRMNCRAHRLLSLPTHQRNYRQLLTRPTLNHWQKIQWPCRWTHPSICPPSLPLQINLKPLLNFQIRRPLSH